MLSMVVSPTSKPVEAVLFHAHFAFQEDVATNFGEANHPDMQAIVDAFNASQDRWELSFIYQGGAGDLLAKVQSTRQEDLPAIFNGPVENIGLYANAEFCAPLQQFIDADTAGWSEP